MQELKEQITLQSSSFFLIGLQINTAFEQSHP